MTKTVLTGKQQLWLDHLKACALAGSTMKAYAEQHGLKLQTLYYWKKYLCRKGILERTGRKRSPFVKAVKAKMPDAGNRISIRFSNGVMIDVPDEFDATALTDLLVAARRL